MSEFSAPPAAQPGSDPSEGGRSSDIPLWILLGSIALLVIASGLAAAALLISTKDQPKAPSYPATWDPRILPFVKIVEEQRGLRFLHPVTVRFLSLADFAKTVTADQTKLSKDDRTQVDQSTAEFRALGLISGKVDLFKAFNQAHGSVTLAYYSFDDQRITIRGDRLTLPIQATLVHEMTHALQDQQFGVGARLKALSKQDASGVSSSESSVLHAILEGDAERIADKYRASLPSAQQQAIARGDAADSARTTKHVVTIPKIVLTMIESPYDLGQALVETAAANGGNAAVDELLRNPPGHDTVLLDPARDVSGDTGAIRVATPSLGSGEKKFETGEFGALSWYFTLAQRLPPLDALQAVDGWGGDAMVGFDRAGTTCMRISYQGRTPEDTTHMFGALQRWATAAPGAPARVYLVGDLVQMESCDPGKAANIGKDASETALGLVVTRAYLALGITRAGAPEPLARCLASRMVQVFPVARLQDPNFGAGDPAIKARVQRLAASCR